MKKICLFLFATVMVVSLVACGGNKETKEATVEEKVVEIVEEIPETPAAPTKTPEETLKAYEDFAKKYAEAYNNIAKDPQTFSKMAGEYQGMLADMDRLRVDFNEAQLKRLQKATDIIVQVNTGGQKK